MRISKLQMTILAVATLGLSACGETFQGTYTGTGMITGAGSCNADATNPYDVEVVARISGDSTEIYISRLVVHETQTRDKAAELLMGINARGPLAGNSSYIQIINQELPVALSDIPAYVNVLGNFETNREVINNLDFSIKYDGSASGGFDCQPRLKADTLTLVK